MFKKSRILADMTSLRVLLFLIFFNLFDCCITLIVHLSTKIFHCFLIQEVEGRNYNHLVLLQGFSVLWRYHILLYNTIKVKKKFGKHCDSHGYVGTPVYCCKNFWSGIKGQSLSSAFKQKELNYLKRTEQDLNWVIKRGKCTWH